MQLIGFFSRRQFDPQQQQSVLDVVTGAAAVLGDSSLLGEGPSGLGAAGGGVGGDGDDEMLGGGVPGEDWSYDPNEPRYCVCNQVSYGDMVACDNDEVICCFS